jgi:hypothetical protein
MEPTRPEATLAVASPHRTEPPHRENATSGNETISGNGLVEHFTRTTGPAAEFPALSLPATAPNDPWSSPHDAPTRAVLPQPTPAPAPTTVNVTIGRVEVTAAPAPVSPRKTRKPASVMTLEAYLRQHATGGGG